MKDLHLLQKLVEELLKDKNSGYECAEYDDCLRSKFITLEDWAKSIEKEKRALKENK